MSSDEEESSGSDGFWGEDGAWHRRGGQQRTREDAILGVFNTSDDRPQYSRHGNKRRRTDTYQASNSTLDFNFVKGGIQTVNDMDTSRNLPPNAATATAATTTPNAPTSNPIAAEVASLDARSVHRQLRASSSATTASSKKRSKMDRMGLPTQFGVPKASVASQSQSSSRNGVAASAMTGVSESVTEDTDAKEFVPAQLDAEFGQWQKYTKGFGAKFLAKHGFVGRLGKQRQGIANPIRAAPVRKGAEGLGARRGGEVVMEQARNAAQELERMRRQLQKKKENEQHSMEALQHTFKIIGEDVDFHKSTPHNGKHKKAASLKVCTASDFLKQSVDKPEKAKIHDYTGPQLNVTTMDQLSDRGEWLVSRDVCPHFRHNVNLVVELVESEITTMHRSLESLHVRQRTLKRQLATATNVQSSKDDTLSRLQSLSQLIDQLNSAAAADPSAEKTIDDTDASFERPSRKNRSLTNVTTQSNGDATASVGNSAHLCTEELVRLFAQMQSRFHKEYIRFQLWKLIPTVAFPSIAYRLRDWDPLRHPSIGCDELKQWRSLLTGEHSGIDSDDNDDDADDDGYAGHLRKKKDMYTLLIEAHFFPIIRRHLREWDATDPHSAVQLCRHLKTHLPDASYTHLVQHLIIPKLRLLFEDEWTIGDTDVTLSIQWIALWTDPTLVPRTLLSSLLSLIRSRLKSYFGKEWKAKAKEESRQRQWDDKASSIHLLLHWKNVGIFYDKPRDLSTIVNQSIIPSLTNVLKSCARCRKMESGVRRFNYVQRWYSQRIISVAQYSAMLSKGFLSQWLDRIYSTLTTSDDIAYVWDALYYGWRSQLIHCLPNATTHPIIQTHLCTALDILNCRMDNDPLPSLAVILQSMNLDSHTDTDTDANASPSPLVDLTNDTTAHRFGRADNDDDALDDTIASQTFRENIESYAQSRGIPFVPKFGQKVDGKAVYLFGSIWIYLSEEVIYARNQQTHVWEPVSLSELTQ